MPLQHSGSPQAFKANVKTLMDERGKSPHVKDSSQALAIAYALKRRGAKRAAGGLAPFKPASTNPPFYVRNEARQMSHVGPINSVVPGRTDNHPLRVPSSSYVLPADHVSSLGQGNTSAGMQILGRMFPGSSGGPYGATGGGIAHGPGAPRPPRLMSDRGGSRGEGHAGPVDIMAAGGEFVVSPADVARIGGGDVKHGHNVLDEWVKANRKLHVKTLRKLPGPAKS